MKDNDVELIHRILEGDDSAFSTLVEKYQKQVHALAWRKIGDFHIAEDITQDTFLKAYQKLTTLKNPQRFAGWLYVIATRCCQAWLRKKQIQTESLEEIDSDALEPEAYSRYVSEEETKVTVAAQRQVVKKLLATLPESERTVITLHYFGEMTCEKMSEFLGVSANTIKSRLRRARNRLKQEEPMIREAITNFKISPTLTENIMQEVSQIKPTPPSASKPLIPWMMGAAGAVLIALMFGIGGQFLARFQKPYSLDAQSERTVELVDAQVVQNLQIESDNRNQTGMRSDLGGRSNGDGENAEQALGDQIDYTRWNLPMGAKRRFGKGILNDMELSPDGRTIASKGYRRTIWLWDAETGEHLRTIKVPNAPATGYQFFKNGTMETTVIPLSQYNPDDDRASIIGFSGFNNKKTKAAYIVSSGPLRSIEFLADSKTLMTQNLDGTVWLWDITSGEQKALFRPELPGLKLDSYISWVNLYPDQWRLAADVYFAPSGEVIYALAAGDRIGTIYIQDGHTGKLLRTLEGQSKIISKKNTIGRIGYGQKTPIQSRLQIPGIKDVFSGKEPRRGVEWITELYFAPDGKTLVSKSRFRNSNRSSYSGAVELWDVKTGELLTRHGLGTDLKFSGDGKALAFMNGVGRGYKGCVIWDLADRRKIAEFAGKVDLKFSRDGKTFTIIRNDSLEMWDIATRRKITSMSTPPELLTVLPDRHAFSGDGTIFAAVNRYGTVNLWETQTDTQLRTLTTNYSTPITTMAFTHDGKSLVSGNASGNIQLWNLNTGKVSSTLTSPENKSIYGLVFAEDNATLVSGGIRNFDKWNITTGKRVNTYTLQWAVAQVFSSTSHYGIGSSGDTVFTWPTTIIALTPKGGKIAKTIWSSHERKTEEDGSEIKVWDIPTSEHLCTVTNESFGQTLAFTSDGNMFATLDEDISYTVDEHTGKKVGDFNKCIVYLWDTYTGKKLAAFDVPKDPENNFNRPDIYAGVFTRDSKTFAAAGSFGDNSIFLWDIKTKTHFATLRGHGHVVCRLTVSPDDTILASGDSNGEIRLWKIPSGEHLVTFQSPGGHISNITFAPDSKSFASTNGRSDGVSSNSREGGTIFLWDVPNVK